MLFFLVSSCLIFYHKFWLISTEGRCGFSRFVLYSQGIFASVARGYSIGVAPIISFKYGQRKTDELMTSAKLGTITTCLLSAISMIVCLVGAEGLVQIFVSAESSQSVNEMAVVGFRIFAFSVVMSGVNIFASAFFTALNDGTTSAILAFTRTFIFMAIPLMILPKLFEMAGVWWSFAVSEGFAVIVSLLYLRRIKNEKWIYRKV